MLSSEVRKTNKHLYKDKKNKNILSLSINPKKMKWQNYYNLLSFKSIPLKVYAANYIGPNFDNIFQFSKNPNLSEQLLSFKVSLIRSKSFNRKKYLKINENLWLIRYKKEFYHNRLQQRRRLYKKKAIMGLKLKGGLQSKKLNIASRFPYAQMSYKMGYNLNKYYKELLISNNFSDHSSFVKSPWLKQADLIFFIDPEKNQGLVDQAKSLRILTLGIVSGLMPNRLGRHSFKKYSLEDSVHYPILGNPTSCFFVQALLDIFIKTLCKVNDSL